MARWTKLEIKYLNEALIKYPQQGKGGKVIYNDELIGTNQALSSFIFDTYKLDINPSRIATKIQVKYLNILFRNNSEIRQIFIKI
jgi:hypothetical protein